MKERWPAVVAGIPLVFLGVMCLRSLFGVVQDHVLGPYGGIDAVMQSGILEWTGRHFWQPTVWAQLPVFYPEPYALAFMDSLLGQAVLVFPLRLWGDSTPALLYNAAFCASFILAAVAFMTLWRSCGGGWVAASVGSLALLGSPFTLSQLGHLNQLPPPMMILALAAILLAIRQTLEVRAGAGRAWWFWALAMVAQAAWGWYGFAYAMVASLLVLAGTIWSAYRNERLRHLLRLITGPIIVVVAGTVLLAQPYWQASNRYDDFTRNDAEISYYSADLKHFLNMGAYRHFWQDPERPGEDGRPAYEEMPRILLHPGWITLVLAFIGWSGRSRLTYHQRSAGLLILAMGAVGLVLAFGDSIGFPGRQGRLTLPLGILQDIFSPLRAYRTVWRFFFLTTLAFSWWAAVGCDVLLRWPGRKRSGAVLVGLFTLLLLLESLPAPIPSVSVPTARPAGPPDPLAALPAGAVLTVPAPPGEYGEDCVEAQWLHRHLSHGKPVTGGVSGWVPPYTRSLRERLFRCEGGALPLQPLLNELHTLGVRYVEVHTDKDAARGFPWRAMMAELGFQGEPSWPGYVLYRLPEDGAILP
jgi:hypothetical protein